MTSGPAQAKYRTFFKKYAELFDGWQPFAPSAVLFAYWGSNPLAHVRPVNRPTLHDHLARTQRPYVALLDATLPEDADRMRDLRVICLQAERYESYCYPYYNLGRVSEMLGWPRRALRYYQSALDENPAFTPAILAVQKLSGLHSR